MKFLIVLVALFAVALARPNDVEILKQVIDVQPDHYSFDVETSDGKSHHEEGVVDDHDKDHAGIVVHGVFSYKDEKDGHVYTVSYVADEHGFQPSGEHLPALPKLVHDH